MLRRDPEHVASTNWGSSVHVRSSAARVGCFIVQLPPLRSFSVPDLVYLLCETPHEPPAPLDQQRIELETYHMEDMNERNRARESFGKIMAGYVWLGGPSGGSRSLVGNLALCQCFACNDIAVWLYDRIVFPRNDSTISANKDMPSDVALDFREAVSIIKDSPKSRLHYCAYACKNYASTWVRKAII